MLLYHLANSNEDMNIFLNIIVKKFLIRITICTHLVTFSKHFLCYMEIGISIKQQNHKLNACEL